MRLPAVALPWCLVLVAAGSQVPELSLPDLSTPAAQQQAALDGRATLQRAVAEVRAGRSLMIELADIGIAAPVNVAVLQRYFGAQVASGAMTEAAARQVAQQLTAESPAALARAEQQLAALDRFAAAAPRGAGPGAGAQVLPGSSRPPCEPPAPMNIRDGEEAALTLRSGACVSGVLIDFGADFTMRVDGVDRRVPRNDVAVIDFTAGGSMSATPPPGGHLIVLRDGRELGGELYDISARRPLKITFNRFDGQHEFSSRDVDRIVLRPVDGTPATSDAPRSGIPAPGAAFALTGVSVPSTIVSDAPAEALTATWTGSPRFPVTLVYAPDSCPPGLNCETVRRTFDVPANPLVMPGAAYCRGVSTAIFFDYSVYLEDASGARSARMNADITCVPRGAGAPPPQTAPPAALQITRVSYNPIVTGGAPPADIAVWWSGNPRFPLRLIFSPDSCPPNLNCQAVVRTFDAPSTPLVGTGMVWCSGYSGPLDYSLRLEDASGAQSPAVNADVTCKGEDAASDAPRFVRASWSDDQTFYDQRRAELQAMLDDIDTGNTLYVPSRHKLLVPVGRDEYVALLAGYTLAEMAQWAYDRASTAPLAFEARRAKMQTFAREAVIATRALRERLVADLAVLNGVVGSNPGAGTAVFDPRDPGQAKFYLQAEWQMTAEFARAPLEFRPAAGLLDYARLVITWADCAPQPPLAMRCSLTGRVMLQRQAEQTILDLRTASYEARDASSGQVRFAIQVPEAGGLVSYSATLRSDSSVMEPGTVSWTRDSFSTATPVGTWKAVRVASVF